MSEIVPPQALDVEKTVLGSMLIDGQACEDALEMLSEESFYASVNKKIYGGIKRLFENSKPVDLLTVTEELQLQDADEIGYLMELTESVSTAANLEYHCNLLRDRATLRGLVTLSSEIGTAAMAPGADPREILDKAGERVFGMTETRVVSEFEPMKNLVSRSMEQIEAFQRGPVHGIVKTGFDRLDRNTGGFNPGDLVIVAGRPSMGKTALVMCMARNVAERKIPVAVFSLEMSKDQLTQRLMCAEAEVELQRIRAGMMTKIEMNRLGMYSSKIWDLPIYIDDSPGINVLELRAKARRIKRKHGIGLIVIDYLQLMSATTRGDNRQAEISHISRSLKCIAKEMDVPVIALSQLSRAVEQRNGDHRPQLSDLRESGSIEQDADIVLFVYREYVYKPSDENLRNIAEIIIGKQRNGPVGGHRVSFIPEYAKFGNLAEGQGQGEYRDQKQRPPHYADGYEDF